MPAPIRRLWTHKSVVEFAGQADPISLVESRARELVLRARDAGWSGPPYNPLFIADLLEIPVEANADVSDARTISTKSGLKIQFNPTRPRERVRFSIAHEIAHTLFSDVAEQTRHRSGPATASDEWQLEMLCNIAAAEFVMPLGSLPAREGLPPIETLMVERREFDVSAEAFLTRVVKTTSESALMFCASPIEIGGQPTTYRVDYSIGSVTSPSVLRAGTSIPTESVINSCVAIGQTNSANEGWISEKPVRLECVGIPAFPGRTRPRVAGLVRFQRQNSHRDTLRFVHGNVLQPAGTGPKLICQLVNDQARGWGGGVAASTARTYPSAQRDFSSWIFGLQRPHRLGRVHFANVSSDLWIASLVAQEGYGASVAPRVRYLALEKCLHEVSSFAADHKATVHMPRIGAGQSGGSWPTVEEIVRDTLVASGVHVTVYDLPPKRQQRGEDLLL